MNDLLKLFAESWQRYGSSIDIINFVDPIFLSELTLKMLSGHI